MHAIKLNASYYIHIMSKEKMLGESLPVLHIKGSLFWFLFRGRLSPYIIMTSTFYKFPIPFRRGFKYIREVGRVIFYII